MMTWGWRHIDGTLAWGISPQGDLAELRSDSHGYQIIVHVANPNPDSDDWQITHQVKGANNAVRLFYSYLQIDRPWKPLTIKHVVDTFNTDTTRRNTQ